MCRREKSESYLPLEVDWSSDCCIRYVNMDYIFVCAIRRYLVLNKLVSYDIACQWSLSLLDRIAKFPAHLRVEIPEGSISYVIPKLHF